MNKNHLRYLLIVALILIPLMQKAQEDINMPTVLPPSPHAYSFLKYGDYPVSHHTGIPDISIPIYKIELTDLELPITLSYHASGIKVNEEASRTGLGWTLNAGGLISRTINKQDDYVSYKVNNYISGRLDNNVKNQLFHDAQLQYPVIHGCKFYNTSTLTPQLLELLFCSTSIYDLSPDLYQYNFNGHSGSFSILHDGTIIKEKEDDNVVIRCENINNQGASKEWKAITPDGTAYTFSKEERFTPGLNSSPTNINTWYLSKIETFNGNVINFYYEQKTVSYYNISNLSQTYRNSENGVEDSDFQTLQMYDITTLSRIDFPNGEILFEYEDNRLDQAYEPSLKSIIVKNKINSGQTVKEVKFNYDYFKSNAKNKEIKTIAQLKYIIGGVPSSYIKNLNDQWNENRLKLIGIDFIAGKEKESYQFKYNETLLPTKLSTARDHWGYYNGKSNNHLIPDQTYKNP